MVITASVKSLLSIGNDSTIIILASRYSGSSKTRGAASFAPIKFGIRPCAGKGKAARRFCFKQSPIASRASCFEVKSVLIVIITWFGVKHLV